MSRLAPNVMSASGPRESVPVTGMDGSGNNLAATPRGDGTAILNVIGVGNDEILAALQEVLAVQRELLAATQQSNVLLAGTLRVKII